MVDPDSFVSLLSVSTFSFIQQTLVQLLCASNIIGLGDNRSYYIKKQNLKATVSTRPQTNAEDGKMNV